MAYSIYKITNTLTGRCYVGLTDNVEKRFAEHKAGIGSNSNLQEAIEKDGISAFEFSIIIDTIDTEVNDIYEVESEQIELHANLPAGVYNKKWSKLTTYVELATGEKHTARNQSKFVRDMGLPRRCACHLSDKTCHGFVREEILQNRGVKRTEWVIMDLETNTTFELHIEDVASFIETHNLHEANFKAFLNSTGSYSHGRVGRTFNQRFRVIS